MKELLTELVRRIIEYMDGSPVGNMGSLNSIKVSFKKDLLIEDIWLHHILPVIVDLQMYSKGKYMSAPPMDIESDFLKKTPNLSIKISEDTVFSEKYILEFRSIF